MRKPHRLVHFSFIFVITGLLLFSGLFTSCDKYAEGPNLTLLTAKSRLVGEWDLTKAESDGNDVTSLTPATTLSILKDDTYAQVASIGGLSLTEKGSWTFNSDKTKVIFTSSGGNATSYTILMLKKDQMKLQEDGAFTDYVLSYSAK